MPDPAGMVQAVARLRRAFYFDHADSAGAGGFAAFEMAQGGNVNAVFPRDLKNSLTGFEAKLAAVDG